MVSKALLPLLYCLVGCVLPCLVDCVLPNHPGCSLQLAANQVTLANGLVSLSFNLDQPQIDTLSADFLGQGKYGSSVFTTGRDPQNLGRKGIVLEVDGFDTQGNFVSTASSLGPSSALSVITLANTTSQTSVLIVGITDAPSNPAVTSNWTITLTRGDRFFVLQTSTTVISDKKLVSVRISAYLSQISSHAFFQKGVVQMMNSQASYFASNDVALRLYTIGGGNFSTDFIPNQGSQQTLLLNAARSNTFFRSGVQFALLGSYPVLNKWDGTGWSKASPVFVPVQTNWKNSWKIAPNNYDFPAASISENVDLPFDSLRCMYTAVYGSPAGSLLTYIMDSKISPTIATPQHAYSGLYNFYDPDTYFSVAAIVYSGDAFLLNEARKLIELSGNHILPSGQIPHHFIDDDPTYVAISGATQTGPNLFWIAATLLYAKNTANYTWLKTWLPKVEQALTFVENLYDSRFQLINAPGPLWIDVFRRSNFTTDTNAFAVHVLREVAEAEIFFGNTNAAQKYATLATNITNGINTHLWSTDHYITQVNPDGSTRDFIDYDSNLLVTAFNIAPAQRASLLIKRVDGGNCTHARATYVSEKYYDAANCYVENTGDSAVTMGRIGYVDALTRNNTGDYSTFFNTIYLPLVKDLFQYTWLYERYTCQAQPTHNNYYIEYPELLVMLTREIVYGINLGLNYVAITPAPGGSAQFHYIIGNIDVFYSQQRITLNLPGAGEPKQVIVGGLQPNAQYTVTAGSFTEKGTVDSKGVLPAGRVPVGGNTVIITKQ